MKFKTFEALLLNCKALYEAGCAKDRRLTEAFGGDTQIMTEWWDLFISETISTISKDMGDEHEVVDWLFWESMCNNDGYVSFWEDDVEYLGSPQNVWLDLKGKLNEGYSVPKKLEFNENDISTQFSKEDIANAHDTKKMDYDFVNELEKIMLPVITLKASGMQVSREFFEEVTDRFDIDLHEVQKYKSYSLVDERGIFYTMTTTKGIIDIQKNTNVEYIKDEPKSDSADAHRNRKIILLKDKQIQLEDTEKAKKLEKMVIKDLEDGSVSIDGFVQVLVLAMDSVNRPIAKMNKDDFKLLADGIDPWAVIPSHKEVPIPNKDFKDNKEFYDYIKYLFECSGVTVIEVATPLPSEENRFKYELKTRKFESMDFHNEIKDLIHEESIFTIYLYSASFIDAESTKTNYNIRLDWSNK